MKDVHELEIYSPIDGFPNYLVTSHGRALSLNYHRQGKMKELKQIKDKNGYLIVGLSKNSKIYIKKVHRLVAQAFIPNPYNKPQVNHIDEDKTNNHLSNLEWVTAKENINHGTHNERISNSKKGKKHTEKTKQKMKVSNSFRAKSVIGFKVNGCNIKYYKHISDCKKDGFQKSTIIKCCKGKLKSAKGYEWYYTDEFFNKNK